ncbi:F-box only protein 15 isoform X3 [Macaca fascicularis]|uniref:F-box only protein 15 isoform X3 n=1 Tax=Macaca fascicularis TaxID=9541 RepID=UPI003D153804
MATGRGRILQQHWLGLQTLRGPSRGGGAARGRARTFGFRKGPGVKCSAGSAAPRCHARGGRHWESSFSCCSGVLDGMPSEILLKIFSYLDAVSLLCAGCVSRRFYHLANDKLRWHSLIARYNLSHLTVSTMIGCDRLIRIFCLHPGLLVGVWKKEEELAFVMANLHFHHLVERSTLGSATIPYELPPHSPFLDDSPEYGLHGYQLHVDLHSGGVFYLCGTFRNLFTKKGNIENGHVKLIVIHLKNNREHLPLIGKVGLSWKTDILDGCIKSCSMMDVTLLDEHGKPFWCFSSPVCMRSPATPADGPSFLGQTYSVDYVDAEGRVHVELVWIRETEEYLIVNLVLYLSIAKINRWFGTEY